jgi:hypothetical protein
MVQKLKAARSRTTIIEGAGYGRDYNISYNHHEKIKLYKNWCSREVPRPGHYGWFDPTFTNGSNYRPLALQVVLPSERTQPPEISRPGYLSARPCRQPSRSAAHPSLEVWS